MKVTVRAALSSNELIGHFVFEDIEASAVTVNSARYIKFLLSKFLPVFRRKVVNFG